MTGPRCWGPTRPRRSASPGTRERPPTVAISSPAAGTTVVGTVTVTATATDDRGVTRVEFYDGATLLGADTSSPYSFNWNTRTGPNGDRTLTAKAYDVGGNIGIAEVT